MTLLRIKIQRMEDSLRGTPQSQMIVPLTTLLKHFNGLSEQFHNDIACPIDQIFRLCSESVSWEKKGSVYWLASRIARLDAFYVRVHALRDGQNEFWNPLELTYRSFIQLHIADELDFWVGTQPYPEPVYVEEWLVSYVS